MEVIAKILLSYFIIGFFVTISYKDRIDNGIEYISMEYPDAPFSYRQWKHVFLLVITIFWPRFLSDRSGSNEED